MPYPNEHAARIRQPNDFKQDSFRRTSGGEWSLPGAGLIKIPETIDIISGQLDNQTGGERAVQALRFPITAWQTPKEARDWLRQHKVEVISFEASVTEEQKRSQTEYSLKSTSLELKDIDEKRCIVKGYFASFNTIDADKDIILPGAFAKSLQERGVNSTSNRKIAHLRNHDWTMQIGRLTELTEDSKGLYFVSQLGRSQVAKDAIADYQDGILREHSIGFQYIADKIKYNELEDCYLISEVKLWEGSAVTFGANENTPVLDVSKSSDKITVLKSLNDRMDLLSKSLQNGEGSDDRLFSIEMQLKYLLSQYKSLEQEIEPVVKVTQCSCEPMVTEDDKRKQLYINLLK